MPKQGGEFSYNALDKGLQSLIGPKFRLDNYWLIDLSLVSDLKPKEIPDLRLEEEFFVQNPKLGEFVHINTLGFFIDPNDLLLDELIQSLAPDRRVWNLVDDPIKHIPFIHELLNRPRTVVLVHCEAGLDRTGEIIGNYGMMYLNMSKGQVDAANSMIKGSPIKEPKQNLINWYCYYLYYWLGIESTGSCQNY